MKTQVAVLAPRPEDGGVDVDGSKRHSLCVFLRKIALDKPKRRRSPGLAGFAANRLGVGEKDPYDAAFVLYRPEHFERAEHLLVQLGEVDARPVDAPPPLRLVPPKPVKQPKRAAQRDLVAICTPGEPLAAGVQIAGMGAADAARLPHDVLLVCQHFAALQQLDHLEWLRDYYRGRRVLAVFRGGNFFPTTAADQVIQLGTHPVLALVDCDPAGLAFALRLPRLEAVCLPSTQALEAQLAGARASQLFTDQARVHAAVLDGCRRKELAPVFQLLRRHGAGVELRDFPLRASGAACSNLPAHSARGVEE